jgi:flagellar basal-body rod protein FlgB
MFGSYIDFIEKNMDISALKRNVTSDNIANFNTPNFKANKVSFDHVFETRQSSSIKTTDDKHIFGVTNQGKPIVYQDVGTKERVDGNNVDLNLEMIEMIKNNSTYSKAVQAMNKELLLNKMAIGQ